MEEGIFVPKYEDNLSQEEEIPQQKKQILKEVIAQSYLF